MKPSGREISCFILLYLSLSLCLCHLNFPGCRSVESPIVLLSQCCQCRSMYARLLAPCAPCRAAAARLTIEVMLEQTIAFFFGRSSSRSPAHGAGGRSIWQSPTSMGRLFLLAMRTMNVRWNTKHREQQAQQRRRKLIQKKILRKIQDVLGLRLSPLLPPLRETNRSTKLNYDDHYKLLNTKLACFRCRCYAVVSTTGER